MNLKTKEGKQKKKQGVRSADLDFNRRHGEIPLGGFFGATFFFFFFPLVLLFWQDFKADSLKRHSRGCLRWIEDIGTDEKKKRMEQFTRSKLRISAAMLVRGVGYNSARASAVETLADVLGRCSTLSPSPSLSDK